MVYHYRAILWYLGWKREAYRISILIFPYSCLRLIRIIPKTDHLFFFQNEHEPNCTNIKKCGLINWVAGVPAHLKKNHGPFLVWFTLKHQNGKCLNIFRFHAWVKMPYRHVFTVLTKKKYSNDFGKIKKWLKKISPCTYYKVVSAISYVL